MRAHTNASDLYPSGDPDIWIVVEDGQHNAFTDLIHWREHFWLAYISSPSHFANKRSRVVILRSTDARHWQKIAQFSGNGEDIRDPKLAEIKDRLFLYALLNKKFEPAPYRTVAAHSTDGIQWSPLIDVPPTGWLLRRPLTADHKTWFAPAHHIMNSAAALLASTDGISWNIHGAIHTGEQADETAIQLIEGGRMLAVTRLEAGGGIFGHPNAGTLISYADAPYKVWTHLAQSAITRLDGPLLFSHHGKVFAAGRRQVHVGGPFHWQGSAIGKYRCALFRVHTDNRGLVHLTDLPSSGDTSYPGVVILNDQLFISFYTNTTNADLPWLLGMLAPTNIQIARFDLPNSEIFKDEK